MNLSISFFTFSIFLTIFLWIGAIAAKFSDNTEPDYLLGNRSFGKVAIGLSAAVTTNSGWMMVGAVGMAYQVGVSAFLMLFSTFLGDLVFWTFFPDKINRMSRDQDSQTVPDFLSRVAVAPQDRRAIATLVGIITAIFVGAYTSGQFAAAAKILNVFFGLDPNIGAIVAAASILVYCVTGGLRASIWTDVVQAIVVIFVSVGMLVSVAIAGGGAIDILNRLQAIDPQLLNITAGFNLWTLLAYIIGFFFFGFVFSLSQPQVVVRFLAGKNPEEVKQAQWIFLGYSYFTWATVIAFGIACRVVIPNINDPEQALPLYAMQNFNPFFIGIVLAGVFSAIASSADSQLLVSSSALARDISPALYQTMSSKYGVKYEQAMTLLVGILAVIATLFISSTVFASILFAAGAIGGSLGPAMFVAIVRKQTHHWALIGGTIAGLLSAIAWKIWGYPDILYEICPGFLIGLLVHELLRWILSKLSSKSI